MKFKSGDTLERRRVRYLLVCKASLTGEWTAFKFHKIWGSWETERDFYTVSISPHMLVHDGWKHTSYLEDSE